MSEIFLQFDFDGTLTMEDMSFHILDAYAEGDWRALLDEVRDSHWLMVYGDYRAEVGYAAAKLGIAWEDISAA